MILNNSLWALEVCDILFQHNPRISGLRPPFVHPDSRAGHPVRPEERLQREAQPLRLPVRPLRRPPRPRLEGGEQVQPGREEEEELHPLRLLAAAASLRRGVRVRHGQRRRGDADPRGPHLGRV